VSPLTVATPTVSIYILARAGLSELYRCFRRRIHRVERRETRTVDLFLVDRPHLSTANMQRQQLPPPRRRRPWLKATRRHENAAPPGSAQSDHCCRPTGKRVCIVRVSVLLPGVDFSSRRRIIIVIESNESIFGPTRVFYGTTQSASDYF
jgi:hypothetical protein